MSERSAGVSWVTPNQNGVAPTSATPQNPTKAPHQPHSTTNSPSQYWYPETLLDCFETGLEYDVRWLFHAARERLTSPEHIVAEVRRLAFEELALNPWATGFLEVVQTLDELPELAWSFAETEGREEVQRMRGG